MKRIINKRVLICLFILLSGRCFSQVLTLGDCLQLFIKDTSFFANPVLIKKYTSDTTIVKGDMYIRLLKNSKEQDNSIMKVVFSDTIRNRFIYTFKEPEQYKLLEEGFKNNSYKLIAENKSATGGTDVHLRDYLLNNMLLTLMFVGNIDMSIYNFSLIIKTPSEKDKLILKD